MNKSIMEKDETAQYPSQTPDSETSNLDPTLHVSPDDAGSDVREVPITEKDHDPSAPPDGGWYAWLQVAGSFLLFFNCW